MDEHRLRVPQSQIEVLSGEKEPLTQGICRTRLPSFAALMLVSGGENNLPSCGLKKCWIVWFACAARRCGISKMFTEGGNASDRSKSTLSLGLSPLSTNLMQ